MEQRNWKMGEKVKCELNCGRDAQPGYHHLIFRTHAPEYINDPRNKIKICTICHSTIHDGTMVQISKLPGFHKMLRLINNIDPQHYQRWVIKMEKAGIKL